MKISMERILKGKAARKAMLAGINKRGEVVMSTIGPKGRNVIFKNGIGDPQVTNDGLTAALNTPLDDYYERLAGDSLIEVAQKVKTEAGDASTTAITVATALARGLFRHADKGADVNAVKEGVMKASSDIIYYLKSSSEKVDTLEKAYNIATISSESEDLGRIVAEIVWEVGENGTVTVEESNSFKTTSEIVKGMQFDGGYISPNMVTDDATNSSIMEDALILVIDKKITNSDLPEISRLSNDIISKFDDKRELVIIANDFDADVMTFLSVNRMRNKFFYLGIKSSGFGHRKFDMLNDICLVTGATLIASEVGLPLSKVTIQHLGRAKKVISTPVDSTIIDSAGDKEKIMDRIDSLKNLMALAESSHEKEVIKKRIAKMAGGVGIIKVGAKTELEMQYLRLKIQDAVRATQSAIQEGYVAGGGTTLYRISQELISNQSFKQLVMPNDFQKGYDSMILAIREPMKKIMQNACKSYWSSVRVDLNPDSNFGYNAKEKVWSEDLIEDGIIDPVKATRSVVENAASGMATLLTAEHMLNNERTQ